MAFYGGTGSLNVLGLNRLVYRYRGRGTERLNGLLIGTGRARPIFDYFYYIILKFASAWMYKAACCAECVFTHYCFVSVEKQRVITDRNHEMETS